MLTHHSIKLMMVFLLAVVLVNIANYIFYEYCKPVNYYDSLSVRKRHIATGLLLQDSLEEPHPKKAEVEQISVLLTNKKDSLCPDIPSGLGPVTVKASMFLYPKTNYETYVSKGTVTITSCKPTVKTAIIVPIKSETVYLYEFIYYLHWFLRNQFIEYHVFVVKQNAESPYHRGRLLNAAFTEIGRHTRFHCIVIQEVGLMPMDTRNLYRCSWYPRQLVTMLTEDDKVTSYESIFGGAIALTPEQIIKCNGFSDTCENDAVYEDMAKRLAAADYVIERPSSIVGNYTIIGEIKTEQREWEATPKMENFTQSSPKDGLNSMAYMIETYQTRNAFIFISINLPERANVESGATQIQFSVAQNSPTTNSKDNLQDKSITENLVIN